MNLTLLSLLELADSPRFRSAPANCDKFGFKAVNRNVGGSNPPRGANSLFTQRVASIFRKLCPLAMKCQVHESRLISINEYEGKSTRACVFEVDQLNRDQPRSIALKPSIRLETECLPTRMLVWRRARLAPGSLARPLNTSAFTGTDSRKIFRLPTTSFLKAYG